MSKKEQKVSANRLVVKETANTVTYKIEVFTDKTSIGSIEQTVYKLNEAGLDLARKELDLNRLEDVNRQTITDAMNEFRADSNKSLERENALKAFKAGTATQDQIKLVLTSIGKGKIKVDPAKLIALIK